MPEVTRLQSKLARDRGPQMPAEYLYKVVDSLDAVAKETGKSIAQVALNWLLTKDERIVPIPGAKNVHQASDNAGAVGWRLSEEEFRKVDEVSRSG